MGRNKTTEKLIDYACIEKRISYLGFIVRINNIFSLNFLKRLMLSSSIFLCVFTINASEKLRVPVVVYYNYHPYYDEESKNDLNSELVATLNAHLAGENVEFYSEYVPKGRLDIWLKDSGWKGLVAWTNPKFLNDPKKDKYQWSESVLEEKDWVVSNSKKPIEFQNINSLVGKTLGTVRNQIYPDVEKLINEGKILRTSTNSQASNIRMLMMGRVDVVFISRSTMHYFKKEIKDFPNGLYFASTPRNVFTRHIMVSKSISPEMRNKIMKVVKSLHSDKIWKPRFDQMMF